MNVRHKYLTLVMLFLISFPLFSQKMYLELNLNDEYSGNPFAKPKPPLETFLVIERATNDKRVQGIILNIADVSRERDYLWELRSALEHFKASGKKICAFISNADIDVYCLASVADKIVMDELGTLNFFGYAIGRGYARNTLDKLGIGVRELRYFEYKSASETFTRNSMSPADRRQYNDYLDDIFNLTRDTLKKARGWTDEEFNKVLNNDFIYSAKSAKDRGLIDYIGGGNAVQMAIMEIEGDYINHFNLYGGSVSSLLGDNPAYSAPKARSFFESKPPIIAVVYANGETAMTQGMEAVKLSRTIRELANKSGVKAIILRVNSPGGSASAADLVDDAVRYAKTRKPVVVSMGQTAASGGYWVAMNASHIVANPYTITGSIGVIGNWFYDNGLNGKLGLSIDTLQRGPHADLMTGVLLPRRNLTDQEEERYKSYIIDLYNIFTGKAAEGRGMELEKLESVAQGRIFSGLRAQSVGLVDSTGGLSDALNIARTLAEISEKKAVKYEEYPKPKFIDKLLESLPMASAISSSFAKSKKNQTVEFLADFILPDINLRYRLENNGKAMPILPLDF
ncbi:MAG: signal peptide peptidase SppA [Treponema sp.]|jgi:protease-4|nr:signal peptide peptidase SppA [Treponema sp.]